MLTCSCFANNTHTPVIIVKQTCTSSAPYLDTLSVMQAGSLQSQSDSVSKILKVILTLTPFLSLLWRPGSLNWTDLLSPRPLGQAPSGSDGDYALCSLVSIGRAQFSCAQPVIVMAAVAGRGQWLLYCDSGFYAADTQGRERIHKGLFHSVLPDRVYLNCAAALFTPHYWWSSCQEEEWFYLQCNKTALNRQYWLWHKNHSAQWSLKTQQEEMLYFWLERKFNWYFFWSLSL